MPSLWRRSHWKADRDFGLLGKTCLKNPLLKPLGLREGQEWFHANSRAGVLRIAKRRASTPAPQDTADWKISSPRPRPFAPARTFHSHHFHQVVFRTHPSYKAALIIKVTEQAPPLLCSLLLLKFGRGPDMCVANRWDFSFTMLTFLFFKYLKDP